MKSAVFLAALAAVLPAYVAAQSQVWGQCGGIGWSTFSGYILLISCTHVDLQLVQPPASLVRSARNRTIITLSACKLIGTRLIKEPD
jgi:hypothetical protein